MGHPLGRLALLHPFPSALVAALTGAVASIAGAPSPEPVVLAVAMLGFQTSIGTLNDLVDAPLDARTKPWKPIAAGRVSRPWARLMVLLLLGLAVIGAWSVSPLAGILGLVGWGCGAAYDLRLKRAGLGWVAFAGAFPILLLYAWTGPTGALPPGWPALLPLAAMAGPTVHLANALADLEDDRAVDLAVVPHQLDRRGLTRLLAGLLAATLLLAWLTLGLTGPDPVPVVLAMAGTLLTLAGLAALSGGARSLGTVGWSLIAAGIATFAVAWLAAAAGPAG